MVLDMQSIPKNAKSAELLNLLLKLYVREHIALAKDVEKFSRYLNRKFQARATTPDDLRIILAIQDGYVTAQDISHHTLIPYETVTKQLNALKALGAITSTRKPVEPGRGGDKKTALHWATDHALTLLQHRAASQRAAHAQKSLLDVIEGGGQKVLPDRRG